MTLPEQLLVSMNMDTEEILSSMRQEYGLKLYQQGKLTMMQAAEFSGVDIYSFLLLLSAYHIPVIDYSGDELEFEVNQFKQ
jgi:predicted HTH domain antitoxin